MQRSRKRQRPSREEREGILPNSGKEGEYRGKPCPRQCPNRQQRGQQQGGANLGQNSRNQSEFHSWKMPSP